MKITRTILGEKIKIELTSDELAEASNWDVFTEPKEQPKQSYKRWRAEKGVKYFFAYSAGGIEMLTDERDEINDFHYNSGNCFNDFKDAESYSNKNLFIQKYKDAIREKNEGWVADFADVSFDKFSLYYDHFDKKFGFADYRTMDILGNAGYFKSKEIGAELLKEFTQEDLIKYLYN